MAQLVFFKIGADLLISGLTTGFFWIADHFSSKISSKSMILTSTVLSIPNSQSVSEIAFPIEDYYDASSTVIHALMPVTELKQHKEKGLSTVYNYLIIFIVVVLMIIGFVVYRKWNKIRKNQFTDYRDSQDHGTPTSPTVSQSEQYRSSLWSTTNHGKRIQNLNYL